MDEVRHAAPGPREFPPGMRGRILVIDDNVDGADMLSMLLEAAGYEVRVAYSGADGLSVADVFCPAVVLCDLGMPHMDGHQVARQIRLRAPLPRPFLVAISGWGDAHTRQLTAEDGFDRHLTKPAQLEEVAAMIDLHFRALD